MKVMLTTIALAFSAAVSSSAAPAVALEGPQLSFEAPTIYVNGEPFMIQVEIQVGETPTPIAAWLMQPGAFTVDGAPLASRGEDELVSLPAGAKVTLEFDLASYLGEREGEFELTFATGVSEEGPVNVAAFHAARGEGGQTLDFMSMPVEQLDDYLVVMQTSSGPMVMEFWPDVAPNHVRNFLDLSQSGFYAQTLFHRVGPGFMIQGGDPNTKDRSNSARWGSGNGPRGVNAEFSDKKHQRGVLSMARSADPNSASSQFFVMHGDSPGLDGQYSVFGRLLPDHAASGATLDRIANSPGQAGRDGTIRPSVEQEIRSATVVAR